MEINKVAIADAIDYLKDITWEISGEYTFCGVLCSNFEFITKKYRWREESTITAYARAYKRIIENLKDHDNRSISSYSKEEFDQVIKTIEGSEDQGYSEQYVQRFRRLIYIVLCTAEDKGICENVLWGSVFSLGENEENVSAKTLVKLKKSLTPKEENLVCKELMSDYKRTDGLYYGCLLMFSMGLRNGEACAAKFGDLRLYGNDPNLKTIYIYKNVDKYGNIKASGKTPNADRVIPVPDQVYDFLMQRKKFLMQELNISEDEVNKLPIACAKDLRSICRPTDLSTVGRKLFKHLEIDPEVLGYIEKDILKGNDPVMIKEKEPTAYLFRRNFATQLFIIGLDNYEIKYIIGHDIDNEYENRNEYINKERLMIIKNKMAERGIFYNKENKQINIEVDLDEISEFVCRSENELDFNDVGGVLKIRAVSCEPGVDVDIKAKNIAKKRHRNIKPSYADDRTVNILDDYHKTYKNYSIKNEWNNISNN